jgi:hypothetical protein
MHPLELADEVAQRATGFIQGMEMADIHVVP